MFDGNNDISGYKNRNKLASKSIRHSSKLWLINIKNIRLIIIRI